MIKYQTEESAVAGFFLIPGYPNYALNIEGVLINLTRGNKLKATKGYNKSKRRKGGYRQYNLKNSDGDWVTVLRHRLMCLLFKEPVEGHDIVNHKNGIPGDDWLDNLEWSTHEKNINHGYDTGLNVGNIIPIEVCMTDGTVHSFRSLGQAGKFLGKSHTVVRYRLQQKPGCIFNDGWGVRDSDKALWSCNISERKHFNKAINITCRHSGKVLWFPSINDASNEIALTPKSISRYLNSKRPYNQDLLFEFA